jgi:hypothetical protein
MEYESTRTVASRAFPGVTFRIRCMSFRRRLELLRSVREAARELDFRAAGESAEDRAEAALQSGRIEQLYLEWGLLGVSGLRIEGEDATAETLIDRGPEPLCREIAAEIRRECALSDEERKN